MAYSLSINSLLDKKLAKIAKKNPAQFARIMDKAEEILEQPLHYKNLRAPLQHLRRVHIDGSFVLIFSVDETALTVTLEDFDHHDTIYLR